MKSNKTAQELTAEKIAKANDGEWTTMTLDELFKHCDNLVANSTINKTIH